MIEIDPNGPGICRAFFIERFHLADQEADLRGILLLLFQHVARLADQVGYVDACERIRADDMQCLARCHGEQGLPRSQNRQWALQAGEIKFGHCMCSRCARTFASAQSLGVLMLKNGSTGSTGHETSTYPWSFAQSPTLRMSLSKSACRMSCRRETGQSPTAKWTRVFDEAQATGCPDLMRVSCIRCTRS